MRHNLFEFMASPVSSEKPKGVTVREIAAAMRRTQEAGEKILAVLGPAVVHTGSVDHICRMIRAGYLNVLFAGNALATHDIEQALYGTSLGVSLEHGLPDRGRPRAPPARHQHHSPAGRHQGCRGHGASSRAASCTSASSTTCRSCWPAASATTARCRK